MLSRTVTRGRAGQMVWIQAGHSFGVKGMVRDSFVTLGVPPTAICLVC